MPVVVPVKFAFAAHELWFDPRDLDILAGDHAICTTERGTEIGLVTADPFEVHPEELAAPLKPVVRIATDADLDRADDLADAGEDAMFDFRRLVEKNGLDMKPVGVEYLFGGEKAVFYFAAEDRVDFRQLVKDLSAHFHVRVDMRQIGVRDETRLQGGYATCGQELCCTRFGGQFEPVSIRMAKEQDLPLNSAKISGVCGRLMCCLRYEFEAYKDFKSRAPKKKTLIDTPLGKARIVEYNTPREQLVLRLENGKVFRVDLADMTSTEENKQRCEAQGCSCRPDCVTRDVLERPSSPSPSWSSTARTASTWATAWTRPIASSPPGPHRAASACARKRPPSSSRVAPAVVVARALPPRAVPRRPRRSRRHSSRVVAVAAPALPSRRCRRPPRQRPRARMRTSSPRSPRAAAVIAPARPPRPQPAPRTRLLLLPKTRRRRAVAASTPPLARRPHPARASAVPVPASPRRLLSPTRSPRVRSRSSVVARVTVAVPSRVPRPMALPVPVPMMPRALPRSAVVVAAANPSRTAETPARPPSSPCARLVFRPHPHRTSSPFPHLRGGAFLRRLEMG